jgi:hypothetical protein
MITDKEKEHILLEKYINIKEIGLEMFSMEKVSCTKIMN